MAVNVQTPFKMVQELLPELTASGASGDPARVINIGSVAGERIEPLQAYSRSEEHTSELQSLMRISYAVFCLKKKNTKKHNTQPYLTLQTHVSHITNTNT